jgi:hypothetical protein
MAELQITAGMARNVTWSHRGLSVVCGSKSDPSSINPCCCAALAFNEKRVYSCYSLLMTGILGNTVNLIFPAREPGS